MSQEKFHQLEMLDTLAGNPEITQADLAAKAGVAVGTVNWYLKQWSKKGWLKAKQIGRWRWQYILTPKGIAERTRLAGKYLEHSMKVYRKIRLESQAAIQDVLLRGYKHVIIQEENEVAEIFRLTCLEMGIKSEEIKSEDNLPRIVTDSNGSYIRVIFPDTD
jgi:DNA-binding MarR family transcriptional regulator